jgi:hypothetical protein
MWPQTTLRARRLMWLSVGLTAAYALVMAFLLYPPPYVPSKGEDLLMTQAVFTGPIMISNILAMLMRRVEARVTLLGFGIGYSILTALIFYSTFGFEHDAGYQLMLFLIPILGFPAVGIAGLTAVFVR